LADLVRGQRIERPDRGRMVPGLTTHRDADHLDEYRQPALGALLAGQLSVGAMPPGSNTRAPR
jgi:hypothetical protein